MIKPPKLNPGDTVAAVSLSWGGPGAIPHRYEAGKRQFEETFQVNVVESEHALRDPEWLAKHPRARAEDLLASFADPNINGIISTIGGDDSIRMLPFLDLDIIRKHPKIFMGYSDTTISHAACFKAGLVSFYGPSFMAGFAENGGMLPYLVYSVRQTLFSTAPIRKLPENRNGWTVEKLDWTDPANQEIKRTLQPNTGWNYHQAGGQAEGILLGGCVEVLDWLRGTDFWPTLDQWDGSILFLETSEEAPPPHILTRFVRTLAATGVLECLSGILLGRPGGDIEPSKFIEYEKALTHTVRIEHGLTDMTLVTNMDFGHTDPICVLPFGLPVKIDSALKAVSINEAAVVS